MPLRKLVPIVAAALALAACSKQSITGVDPTPPPPRHDEGGGMLGGGGRS